MATRHRRRDYLLRRSLVLIDAIGILGALLIAAALSSRTSIPAYVGWGTLVIPAWIVLFNAYGLYDRDVKRVSHTTLDDVPWLAHAVVIGSLMMWAYYKVVPVKQLHFQEFVTFAASTMVLVLLLRAVFRHLTTRLLDAERVLVVGEREVASLVRKIRRHPEYGLKPIGILSPEDIDLPLGLPHLGELNHAALEDVVIERNVDRIVLSHTTLEEDEMLDLLRRCRELHVKISVLPQLFDVMGPSVEVDDVEGVTVLGINPPVLSRSQRAMKRALDTALSLLMLVVLAPVMVLIYLAIRLDSPGPAFFRQSRIGRDGRRFEVVKFRTMVTDAETRTAELMKDSQDPDWLKLERDPRVTRVGRLLRHASLDELPQLWNVLKGEMSLIGPRPLPEADDRMIEGWARGRLDLTPGISGPWQVLGRTDIPFAEMVKLDYLYVANWSLWTDVRLLIRTIPAVLARRGVN